MGGSDGYSSHASHWIGAISCTIETWAAVRNLWLDARWCWRRLVADIQLENWDSWLDMIVHYPFLVFRKFGTMTSARGISLASIISSLDRRLHSKLSWTDASHTCSHSSRIPSSDACRSPAAKPFVSMHWIFPAFVRIGGGESAWTAAAESWLSRLLFTIIL